MARTRAFDEEEVLQKAIDLFWEKGYHGTSMDDLVKTMGINRASLYNTFSNKRSLYERALQTYRQTNQELVIKLLRNAEPTVETLQLFFQAAIGGAEKGSCNDPGCFIINSTTELANLDVEIQDLVRSSTKKLVEALTDFLKRMQEAGNLSPDRDCEGLANLIFATFSGLRINRMMDVPFESNQAAVATLLTQLR